MNDFEGLFPSDYGFRPSSTRPAPISGSRSGRPAPDPDSIFSDARSADFPSVAPTKPPAYDFDSVFEHRSNSEPVYDKPVYDDDGGDGIGAIGGDIFHGVPGVRSSAAAAAASSSSARVKFDDVFESVSSSSPPRRGGGTASAFDDLLGGFGKAEPRWKSPGAKRPEKSEKSSVDFDDLIPGFGAGSLPTERSAPDANRPPENFAKASKTTSKVVEDPFVSTGQYSDPLEEISKFSNSRSMKTDSVGNGRLFDDVDPFEGLVRPGSSFNSERENRVKETSNLRTESNTSGPKTFTTREMPENPSVRSPDNQKERKVPVENDWDSHQTYYDMPTAASDTHKSFGQTTSPPYGSGRFKDSNPQVDRSPPSEENVEPSDDIWLTASEIPLFTQPTSAPPPSRPPPPKPVSKTSSTNARRKNNEFSSFPNPSQNFQVPNSTPAMGRSSVVSPIDELEDFVRGRSQDSADEHVNGLSSEELEMNSAAIAMKEAMDRAHAKIRQAKEVRERENSKSARSKEGLTERDEKLMQDERAREKQERLERQRLQREKEDEEMEQQRLEREMEMEREREEKEREQRRVEKEKERAREIERERERARQAVERATREARERAAIDARQKAERLKAERAAVDKANSEARERAERAAVQRAQSEARERAAIEAKERAERVASEARERAHAESAAAREREARERAAVARAEAEARARASERAAVGRAAAEARERAAADARDRAAAAARASQQKNENDIESFFSSRASSAPRPRTTSSSSDPFFDAQPQSKRDPEVPRGPSGNPSNIRKASSSANIVDDLSSIFGAAPSSGEFNDIEGESDERRRARLERHQRTQERAAKALAEKNQRDLQIQRDQAERNRFGEALDAEIKRWASGKEGNLRALLSTLQYVLWPECGWQPVSLTDMITPTSVKKVYRRATLCIHPDKVQQKGANIQQKYVAEKVFDLLKEAWNKFNSEELF